MPQTFSPGLEQKPPVTGRVYTDAGRSTVRDPWPTMEKEDSNRGVARTSQDGILDRSIDDKETLALKVSIEDDDPPQLKSRNGCWIEADNLANPQVTLIDGTVRRLDAIGNSWMESAELFDENSSGKPVTNEPVKEAREEKKKLEFGSGPAGGLAGRRAKCRGKEEEELNGIIRCMIIRELRNGRSDTESVITRKRNNARKPGRFAWTRGKSN